MSVESNLPWISSCLLKKKGMSFGRHQWDATILKLRVTSSRHIICLMKSTSRSHTTQRSRLVLLYKLSKVEGVAALFSYVTLSMCGCQYSSCWVLAAVLLILEKKVGLVRYIRVGSKPNVSAITAWIRPRTSLTVKNRHNLSD